MYCLKCKKEKDDMDMHSEVICKNCWVRILEDQTSEMGTRGWITRRERYGPKGHKGFYKGKEVEEYFQ